MKSVNLLPKVASDQQVDTFKCRCRSERRGVSPREIQKSLWPPAKKNCFFFFSFFFFSSSSRAGFLLCGFAVGVAAFKVDAMLKTHTLLNTTGCLDDVHENCPFVSAVIFFFVGPAMRCSWCHACTHPLRCLLVFGACVCRGAVPQTSTHSLPCLCACERKTAT